MFFVTLLKEKRCGLFWRAIGSALFCSVMFVPAVMQWMDAVVWITVIYLGAIPFIVCQLLLLSLAAKRGKLDARLLLGPFSLQYGTSNRRASFRDSGLWIRGLFDCVLAGKWDSLFEWPFPVPSRT